jgi:hypothetical protein
MSGHLAFVICHAHAQNKSELFEHNNNKAVKKALNITNVYFLFLKRRITRGEY